MTFTVIENESIETGDSIVQFGSGTKSVWRTGKVVSIHEDKAKIQFETQSDGTSWLGHSPIVIELNLLKKIA